MQVELTGRHFEITPAIREHVETQLDKLNQFLKDKPAANAHVVITIEKNRQTAEIVVNWREHVLKASESDKDLYQAINKVVDKLEKQARRMKEKVVNRKLHAKPTAEIAPEPEGEVTAEPLPPRIIPVSNHTLKPMTAEEALLSLRSDSNQFVVFRDAETERISVLYKRADGNFGLIEP